MMYYMCMIHMFKPQKPITVQEYVKFILVMWNSFWSEAGSTKSWV